MDEIILRKHEYTIRAKQVLKRTGEDIVELSQICAEYHKEFGYQEYIRWVQDDLGISETYGKRFLNVYKQYGSTANLAVNFNPSALYLLASPSTPESAREEALTLAESGEKISHTQALKIVAKHKAEAEVAQKELVSKQQIITSMEDRLTTLEAKKNELAREKIFMLENKNADVSQMMNQTYEIERLNQQIEELKSTVPEPQVITQEVRVEVIPADYKGLKQELGLLKTKLRNAQEKSKGIDSETTETIDKLKKELQKKEERLSKYNIEEIEGKALSLITRAQGMLREAIILLKSTHLNQYQLKETIFNFIKTIKSDIEALENPMEAIDIEVLLSETVEIPPVEKKSTEISQEERITAAHLLNHQASRSKIVPR